MGHFFFGIFCIFGTKLAGTKMAISGGSKIPPKNTLFLTPKKGYFRYEKGLEKGQKRPIFGVIFRAKNDPFLTPFWTPKNPPPGPPGGPPRGVPRSATPRRDIPRGYFLSLPWRQTAALRSTCCACPGRSSLCYGDEFAGRIANVATRRRLTVDSDSRWFHHVYLLASLVTGHSHVTSPPVGLRSGSRQGHHMGVSPLPPPTEEGRVPVALSRLLLRRGAREPGPGRPPRGSPLEGGPPRPPRGPPGPPCARSGGSRGPPRDPDPRGPKMAHFCPPAVQSRGGVGGLRPLT